MSTHLVAVVHCDACGHERCRPGTDTATLRTVAHIEGWRKVGREDWCPACASKLSGRPS